MSLRQTRDVKDAAFARRLTDGDDVVRNEIYSEYAPPLKAHLEKSKGLGLTEEDVEDILQEVFIAFFEAFKPRSNQSVRGLLFKITQCQRDQWFRRYYRSRFTGKIRLDIDDVAVIGRAGDEPITRLLRRQRDGEDAAKLRVMDECIRTKLSIRQRQALEAWMNAANPNRWAKHLEDQTGVSAQAWRCARDEAKQRVRAEMEDRGLFNNDKERDHVLNSRGTA